MCVGMDEHSGTQDKYPYHDYTEISIGYAFGDASDYGTYWTAVFANP
jgi:hypothetical protein